MKTLPARQLSPAMASGGWLALWILTSCQAFLLQGPTGPLVAQLGGSVLLPCAAETPLPLEELEVEWRRTDSGALVHLFQDGDVRPESQDDVYRDRANFVTEGFATGNYSLVLTNVTRANVGIYICKVYTNLDSGQITAEIIHIDNGHLSANITTVLQGLGPPPVLVVALMLCASAFILALGLGIPSFIHLTRNDNTKKMLMHCSLVLCPNTIMFIAFMLYGVTHGFGAEITTCATLNLIRFLLVFKTSPYLDILPACPKKYIKGIGIMLHYLITAGVLFSGVFAEIAVIHTFFLLFFTGMQLFYYIMNMLFGGINVLEYWCFTYVDIMNWILLWLLVVGYSVFSFRMFIITLACTLGVDVLFHLQQRKQYKKFYAISTILIVVFFPVCIGAFFYYLYWILASKPGGPGLMFGSALLYSLTAASGFDHPKTTTDIPMPHIIVYMFGAAALAVINAVTLATELITIMVTGARMCNDLQVIVLPSECVFVCGWIALQLYHYWIRKREIIKGQFRDISKKLRCKDVTS
ncbi:hypothetical protein ACEWY4_015241 [Coilia grayii]|uniref:Ig-like domain-containing protein n=1 Tax=Coilia grayii TaxID=363190 RepID=A0ABD1JMK5_9TELE